MARGGKKRGEEKPVSLDSGLEWTYGLPSPEVTSITELSLGECHAKFRAYSESAARFRRERDRLRAHLRIHKYDDLLNRSALHDQIAHLSEHIEAFEALAQAYAV